MVSNMKELCEYVANKRKIRKHKHQELLKIHGECSRLTDQEYKKVKHRQKSSYPQQYKYTHSKMWRTYVKKYSVDQLKVIAKS